MLIHLNKNKSSHHKGRMCLIITVKDPSVRCRVPRWQRSMCSSSIWNRQWESATRVSKRSAVLWFMVLLKPDNSVKAAYKPSQGALTVIPVIAQLLGPCLPPRRIHHPGLQFIRCSASSGCVKHPFCTCSGPQMCKLWPEYWRFAVSHQNKPPLHA